MKNYVILAFSLFMTLGCIVFSSCNNEINNPNPELSVSTINVEFNAKNNRQHNIYVTAKHTNWFVHIVEGHTWLQVNKEGEIAKICATENKTRKERTGKIRVEATVDATICYDVNIIQQAADESFATNVDSIQFEAKGGEQIIKIISNSGWSVHNVPDWLLVDPMTAEDNILDSTSMDITLKATENITYGERVCTLTFTTIEKTTSTNVIVSQKSPEPYLLVNETDSISLNFNAHCDADDIQRVTVSSNVNWSINNIPEWISVSPTKGIGITDIIITPKTNNDTEYNRIDNILISSEEKQAVITVNQKGIKARTVIAYIMAENSLNRFASSDLNEIRTACGNIPENTNLLVYVDNSSLPIIYNVTAEEGMVEWKTYDQDQISTDSTAMQHTLKEIITNFPAKNYGLVLWSHGSGWVPQTRSIGIDNGKNTSSNSGLQMNIPTLRGVLETLPHLEFILFDASTMQSIEVAYELHNVTDYIIGSPTEIHAEGAPYDTILGPMMRGDVLEVVKQYYSTYQNWDGVVISLLDCRKMETFAQATAKVMPQFSEAIKTNGVEGVQIYQPYSSQNEWKPEPFDMEGAMHHALDSASFAEWKTALNQILLYKNATSSWTSVFSGHSHCHLTDPEHYSAFSIFLPNEKYASQGWNEKFHEFQWYKAAGWDKAGW